LGQQKLSYSGEIFHFFAKSPHFFSPLFHSFHPEKKGGFYFILEPFF